MAQSPVLAFDTHAAVVELVEAGMPERQAELVVRLQGTLIEQHFATKADIATVNAAIESLGHTTTSKQDALRQEFTSKQEALRQEFTLKLDALRQDFTSKLDALRQDFSSKQEAFRQEFASKQELTSKLDALRQEFKADIASLKAELIKWMIGTNLAFATLVIAAVKVL